jgi:hypothetical protein
MKILVVTIKQVGSTNVVQVVTDNAHVCKAGRLIVKGKYNHLFWTSCVVLNLNPFLEEFKVQTPWIKELTGKARDILKFITNHH